MTVDRMTTTNSMNTRTKRLVAIHGSMGWGLLLLVLLLFSVFPSSSHSQSTTTEVITGQDTKSLLPDGTTMQDFTTTGHTKHNTNTTGTSQGCKAGNFCTGGAQVGGTYQTDFDMKDSLTIEQINRGFTLDSSVDVDSHVSNIRVPNCVTTLQTGPDCKDVFSLTIKLFDSATTGQNLVHEFKHEVELDFSGLRNFAFQDTVPENQFSSMTGTLFLFGIDAGFNSKFFGPAFSNPALSATFDLVTLIETEIIDVINTTDIINTNTPVDTNVTDVTVEVNNTSSSGETQQVATLQLEVESQMEIPSVELAPPAPPPVEAPVENTQVAEVTAEIENAQPEQMDMEPTVSETPTESSTQSDTASNEGEQSNNDEPRTEDTAAEEPAEENSSSASATEPEEEQPAEQQTAEAEETTEEANAEAAPAEKPKPKKTVKAKEKSKKEAKQKVARKIVKKMGDKGRYDQTNQLKTLVVMTVLGNTRSFFNSQVILPDAAQFYSPTQIPGGRISDNELGGFMFNDSAVGHNALVDMQYK